MRGSSRRQLVGLLAFGWAACSCTVQPPESSPKGEGPLGEADQGRAEIRLFDVVDHASRFRTRTFAVAAPEVTTQVGYVRVRIPLVSGEANCFVYDKAISAGGAVVRLLAAAETGIAFQRVIPISIESSAGNPLVFLRADYLTTMEPRGVSGAIKIALSPRANFPIVCTLEAENHQKEFGQLARAFAEHMEPASSFLRDTLGEGEKPMVEELWVRRAEGVVAFRQWRAARGPEGDVSTLEITSTFESGGATLRVSDARVIEKTDAEGLIYSEWLEVLDGEREVQAGAKRVSVAAGRHHFEVRSRNHEGDARSEFFSTEPLASSFDLFRRQFDGAEEGAKKVHFLYEPRKKGANRTEVVQIFSAGGVAQQTVGDVAYAIELGADGLPTKMSTEKHNVEWILLSRSIEDEELRALRATK